MIAVDTNVLVYAHRQDSPFHSAAARCLRQLAQGKATWAIAWPCLHEFYSICTHPRLYVPPSTPAQAANQIDIWLASPSLLVLSENGQHWPTLRELIEHTQLQGPMVHDARIAALCLAHGIRELWSADRDFQRFPGLRTRNPLV